MIDPQTLERVASITSPDGQVQVGLAFDDSGVLHYQVDVDGTALLAPSALGVAFQETGPLREGLEIAGVKERFADETWEPVWGASSSVRNRYRELSVEVGEKAAPHRGLTILLRAYNDGVAFRYVFPEQESVSSFAVTDELTEFRFAGEGTAWWTPADYDSYEYLYEKTSISEAEDANTPVTVKTEGGLYAALHEAALRDYPDMTLERMEECRFGYRSGLVPLPETGGIKARVEAPFETPWRTITIGRRAGDLIESNLILNLNDPSAIDDTSWIRPGTYIGIWWLIHKGQATWKPGEHAGATTDRAKQYIDFAATNGIPYVLIEGWNVGWAEDWDDEWAEVDFTSPNEGFDLREVVQYASDRGVELIGHLETGGNVQALEDQLEDALQMYRSLGVRAVKTGYVGDIPGHHHHDQWMVQHHQRVIEKAAEYGLMVNAHEPIKPTGMERTWPNAITREAVRGMEYNAWSEGNPAAHTVTLPFTRMLAGPLDYTPGIFDVTWDPTKLEESEVYQNNEYDGSTRVHTTRARQMALGVVFLSGLQMLADLPEHYEGEPEFAFFRDLPATWDETRVISGEIGEHLVIARRSGLSWFVAVVNDEEFRELDVPLSFLRDGRYTAHIYADADGTDFKRRPNDVALRRTVVTGANSFRVPLGSGGGWVARIVPE